MEKLKAVKTGAHSVLLSKIANLVKGIIASRNYNGNPKNKFNRNMAIILLREYCQIIKEVNFDDGLHEEIVKRLRDIKELLFVCGQHDKTADKAYRIITTAIKSFYSHIIVLMSCDHGIYYRTSAPEISKEKALEMGIVEQEDLDRYEYSKIWLRWHLVRPGDIIKLYKYVDDDYMADEPYIEEEVVTKVITEDDIFEFPQRPPKLATPHEPGAINDFYNSLKFIGENTRIENVKTPNNDHYTFNKAIFADH